MKQKQIFIAFLRSGLLGFGGGPAGIPLIKKEVVDTFKMLTEDEFYEIMAIGNTLPGPIITKLAGYIGYRVGGVLGLLNAILASILPSILMMLVLFKLLFKFKYVPFVAGMTNGVLPIIGVMMLIVFLDLMKKTKKSLGWLKGGILLVATVVCIFALHIHPGFVVGVTLLLALFLPVKKGERS
ncbi:hypothetical protein PAESOLCIP111_06400 [Paenibacillus solanacearum]|uniref:Chromate transporter n=1 Tax=Paenibacillus solanacearum TaxID=2048548 RepID=A0A916K7V6_9BACL|nr:chromate transporter [Paenibacillus solanacearum]CAG7651833.1 hypothetical protein PAESOLCIP111_06400 [Paenibacillus solanacearum]